MLEKIGTLFAHIVYIEGIIKDLIILKENPKFVNEINKSNPSKELNEIRKEIIGETFTPGLLDRFFSLYQIDEHSKKQLIIFRELRDIYGHSRIWKNHKLINHVPYEKKFEERTKILGLNGEGGIIKFNKIEDDFDRFIPILLKIEDEFFPQICKDLSLDYEKIK